MRYIRQIITVIGRLSVMNADHFRWQFHDFFAKMIFRIIKTILTNKYNSNRRLINIRLIRRSFIKKICNGKEP